MTIYASTRKWLDALANEYPSSSPRIARLMAKWMLRAPRDWTDGAVEDTVVDEMEAAARDHLDGKPPL